ncbi:hypothetical protein IV203_005066 [Nitzschia inconspicua]|uniref:Uncharacterized protein n=1 Tax=Nitzschia inconspicua TaxID=303405 RepID=A0A9K3KMW1_9STRA|nr:hypothetical protein IV203_005066 [Nitzschia inconspicua]
MLPSRYLSASRHCGLRSKRGSLIQKSVSAFFVLLPNAILMTTTLPPTSSCTIASAMSTTATNLSIASDFFVLGRDRGTVRTDLPVWASRSDNPFQLVTATRIMEKDTAMTCNNNNNDDENAEESNNKESYSCPSLSLTAQRHDVDGVPGAFQILNVLSKEEAKSMGTTPQFFIDIFEELGFTDDAAVSLPRKIRHNSNLVWISDDVTLDILWNRLDPFFVESAEFLGRRPMGLNGRFRVYRYEEGDFF